MDPKSSNSSLNRQGDLSGADVLRSLSPYELAILLDKLRAFVFNHYYGNLRCEDLAMEAMKRVLLGKRKSWNSAYPPFENLCWIIKSLADNQLKKEKRTASLEVAAPFGTDDLDLERSFVSHNSSPAELYEASETKRFLCQLINRATNNDGLLGCIVELALDAGHWKPRLFARELQINVREVQNAKRRMQRRLEAMHYSPSQEYKK